MEVFFDKINRPAPREVPAVLSPKGRFGLLALGGGVDDVVSQVAKRFASLVILDLGLLRQLAKCRRHVELVVRQTLLDDVEPSSVAVDLGGQSGDRFVLLGVLGLAGLQLSFERSDTGELTLIGLGVDAVVQDDLHGVETESRVQLVEIPALGQEDRLVGAVTPLVDALVVGHGIGADLGGPFLFQFDLDFGGHGGQLGVSQVDLELRFGVGGLAVLDQLVQLELLLLGDGAALDVRDGHAGESETGGQDQNENGQDGGQIAVHGFSSGWSGLVQPLSMKSVHRTSRWYRGEQDARPDVSLS